MPSINQHFRSVRVPLMVLATAALSTNNFWIRPERKSPGVSPGRSLAVQLRLAVLTTAALATALLVAITHAAALAAATLLVAVAHAAALAAATLLVAVTHAAALAAAWFVLLDRHNSGLLFGTPRQIYQRGEIN
jgi:hypothetical protein